LANFPPLRFFFPVISRFFELPLPVAHFSRSNFVLALPVAGGVIFFYALLMAGGPIAHKEGEGRTGFGMGLLGPCV
jgi:hypothetical protein